MAAKGNQTHLGYIANLRANFTNLEKRQKFGIPQFCVMSVGINGSGLLVASSMFHQLWQPTANALEATRKVFAKILPLRETYPKCMGRSYTGSTAPESIAELRLLRTQLHQMTRYPEYQ